MPWRMSEGRTCIKFMTYTAMPSQINRASQITDKVSNTEYIQHAICEALARDLNIPLQTLLDRLPPVQPRDPSGNFHRRKSVEPVR